MTTPKQFIGFLGLMAVLMCVARPAWSQCAMCKEAIETDADTNSTGTAGAAALTGYTRGIFLSIFFLLGMLFTTAGGVVFLIMRDGRQSGNMMEFMDHPADQTNGKGEGQGTSLQAE
ncbi:MAG: hypothetical protein QF437_11460 [Planctomycetota bacterium]|jgi:hypothetical protein|nr:hypothetical protein [Planctomycetota bacterium]MDP7252194.1 hypothetical protein [Planctomycetota bacterium]